MTKLLKGLSGRAYTIASTEEFISGRVAVSLVQPFVTPGDGPSDFFDEIEAVKSVSEILVLDCPSEKLLLVRYLQAHGSTVVEGGFNQLAPNPLADEPLLNVVVGGSVSGNIDFTGDTDDVRVFLVAGQTYLVSLRGTGADPLNDSFLEVYNPSNALVNFDDDGGNDLYSMLTFTASVTGNFTIRASSFSNPGDPGTGGYTVDVRVQGVDAVGATNAESVVMNQGTTFGFRETATVSGGADLDRYQVTLEAGKFYTFKLAAGADYATNYTAVPTGEIDTILRLRTSAGTLVATNDDINFPGDISSALGFYATVSGTYYLDVTGYAGQTGGYIVDFREVDYAALNPLDSIDWENADVIDTVDVNGTPTAYVYFGLAGETFGEAGLVTFGWNAKEKAAVMSALAEYTEITGITYVETFDINQAEFRLNTVSTGNFGAYFYPQDPAFGTQQGIGIFNVNSGGWDKPGVSTQDIPGDQVSLDQGGFAYAVILHEFGHAHGLAHPHDTGGGSDVLLGVTGPSNSYGIFNLNQGVYTVMSYNDAWDFHPDGPSPFTIAGIGNGWSGTLGAFDIAQLQMRYGVHAHNTGDNVYTLASVQQSGVFYETIWDSGGTDTIVYGSTGNARIDLTAATLDYSPVGAGVLSFVDQIPGTAGVDGVWGGFTIANGVVIENATGGSGNDVLIGNGVANVLTGNNGNDTFIGRGGDDTIHGGAGNDTARYDGNRADYNVSVIVTNGVITGFTVEDTNTAAPADSNNPLLVADEGTDTLDGVEMLQFADSTFSIAGAVAVFDTNDNLVSVHTTIQAAIDAVTTLDGYSILASGGTYVEDVNVTKDLTIRGANDGLAGTDPARFPETIIDGRVTISADGVTIDGVSIVGDGAGPLGSTGVVVDSGSDDFSLVNSVLNGSGDFAIFVGLVSGLDVGNNLIQGYSIGMYIAGGNTSGSVHDNLFQGDGGPFTGLGNGVNSETSFVLIQNNVFDGIYAGSLNLFPFGPDPVDLDSYVIGNTISDSGPERPVQVYPTALSTHIVGTDFNEAFNGDIAGLASGTELGFDGQGGDDHIYGWDAADELSGGSGSDRIFAQQGDDVLNGGSGNDLLDGGAGIDTAVFAVADLAYFDTVIGWLVQSSEGNDFLQQVEIVVDGTGQRTLLVGSTGFATLQAALNAAEDGDAVRLASATYTGTVTYDDADLTVLAQPGATLNVTFTTTSGEGITVYGAGADDNITTGEGDDRLYGGAGNDTMAGGTGDDWYFVDAGDTVIEGAAEGTLDRVFASTSYTLTAGAYIEILSTDFHAGTASIDLGGNELDNLIYGNAGDNRIDGHAGADAMIGFGGNDFYFVDNAGDFIVEGASEGTGDRVFASTSYTLSAGAHIEIFSTDFHAATTAIDLSGNELGNLIYGNAGSNVLDGKEGNDALVGFGGADTFAFTTALGANNVDIIADFDADDVIALDDAVFTGLSLGALDANAFVNGTAAQDADDRIIYNQATGELFYDADGNGAGAQVLFATLSGNPILTASDFTVI